MNLKWGSRLAAAVMLITTSAYALPALAQVDKATAEAMLNEGLSLKASGQYEQACAKLEESFRIYASVNTQYHLADCREKQGKIASAWIAFNEVAAKSAAAGEKAKEEKAHERAAALSPKLSRLTISVKAPTDNLVVKRAGVPIGRAQWGSALPIDPGEYVVEADAPGKTPWKSTVKVEGDGANVTVEVPELADATATTTKSDLASVKPVADAETAPASPGSGTKTLGLVVGGVGLVAMGVSTVMVLSAKSAYDGASCTDKACDQNGLDTRNSARSKANVSTVVFGIGAAAAVTGVVLWLVSPSKSSPASDNHTQSVALRAGITPGGVMLGGSF